VSFDPDSPFRERLAGAPPLTIGSGPGAFVVVEWRDPGGGQDPPMYVAPLHIHHDDDELWYVLEGTLTVRLDGEDHSISSGGAVMARRGVAHTYWNPRPEPCRYLLVMTQRIKELIDAIHASEDRSAEGMSRVFAAHDSEYLGWP